MTLIDLLRISERLFDEARNASQTVAMWQLTEVSKVAIDMVGLFGSNKVKKSVDTSISQRTGGKVRSRLREQNKIVRLRKISATWRPSGISINSGGPPFMNTYALPAAAFWRARAFRFLLVPSITPTT